MDTQNNSTNNKQVDTTKSKTKKRKIGCLGCFGYVLLTIVIIAVAFFAVKTIQKKIEEKEVDTLRINPTKNTANDMWKVYQKIWYTFLACYRKSSPPLK